ncbi:DUF721 domain-containing protein [Stieleria varia]|uniref:DUF721 domain-containing protein n=1 Tax=Stieleria varia TaxID=2528005 RepID=A0A5C6A0G0_9BACT|nr:DUF721 domain-containing protein [Stieleria varia]TWT92678.1 hypothetical protein Pla52n_60430 [Stieleria varia]
MAKKRKPVEKKERQPIQKIGALVNQLLARRGYAAIEVNEQLHAAIASAVPGELGDQIIVGRISRGVLQVFATDSVVLQEITFQKRAILKRIQKELPQSQITDLRFRIQTA